VTASPSVTNDPGENWFCSRDMGLRSEVLLSTNNYRKTIKKERVKLGGEGSQNPLQNVFSTPL